MSKPKQLLFILLLMSFPVPAVYFSLVRFNSALMTFILYYLICCLLIPLTDIMLIRRKTLPELLFLLGFKDSNWKKTVLIGFLHGLILFLILLTAYGLSSGRIDLIRITETVRNWGLKGDWKIPLLLVVLFFNGAVEEIFWRGYCHERMSAITGSLIIVPLISIFYTSYHLVTVFSMFGINYLSIITVTGIFGLGLIWSTFRYLYKSIWISLVGHYLVTAGYIVVYLLIGIVK